LGELITEYKIPVELEIFDTAACSKLGLNLLVAVGGGSDGPRKSGLVVLKYSGACRASHHKYCIIGKGITQDTGGYSLKPVADIPSMKSDKSGAVIALTTLLCCARLGLPLDLIAVLPLAQNSIGPGAIVPGDIITAYNGLTVEITDPDAEGRLILADAIAYAVDKWPKHQLIDIATLTGEQEAMSCKKFSTLIHVNSADVADDLVISGELAGERLVMMPYLNNFEDTVESDVADLRNSPAECDGDIYPATVFMASFLKPSSRWVHIDLGGNTYGLDRDYLEEGDLASGVGVRLLMEFLADSTNKY
jgi:leucyl aminopeptidase